MPIKNISLSKLKDCTEQLDNINAFLKDFLAYKRSLLEFGSANDKDMKAIEANHIPENYYCFRYFDKSVCLVRDYFEINSDGLMIRSKINYYHIYYYGYRSKLPSMKKFNLKHCLNKQQFGNFKTYDEALLYFHRSCLELLCIISDTDFDVLDNVFSKQEALF